jgi:DNA polymerase elongation subunit (family B)
MAPIVPRRLAGHMVGVTVVRRKDFWGFTNGTLFPFARIRVRSLALFNALKRYFEEPATAKLGYRLYESNIDPFLRFIHERNLAPCGWVRLPAHGYDLPEDGEAASRTQIVADIEYAYVEPVDKQKIAPLLIASFDIECTSSHGDFPVAIKDYRKLAQDLMGAAATAAARPSAEVVRGWLEAAFDGGTGGGGSAAGAELIHRVYPKSRPRPAALSAALDNVVPAVLPFLDQAAKLADGADRDESDDEADEGRATGTIQQKRSKLENDVLGVLNRRLLKAFPLKGDAAIQIGTTVHVYGSDQIVFRHMASLGTCDPIPGAYVDVYETEGEMLLGWKAMLGELDPDILIGYNIFGFDMDYLWTRAAENGVGDQFGQGLGRLQHRSVAAIREQKLSSSALGDNILKYFNLDGVVSIDLLKVMQRDQKLDSYKLDDVAALFLGDRKDDLSPNDIFRKFAGDSADRAEIARYCLQDCALVNRLLHKLKVLENNIGMGNVCSVPLSYLFMRGQGIKIFSLVSKECAADKALIPVVKPPRNYGAESDDLVPDEVGYEGAIVLEPKEGMYLDTPITVLDYASLYPSSMIERNLSHDCFVDMEKYPEYASLPPESGVSYITVKYDVYEGTGDKKRKVGDKECTFAQLPAAADGTERKGIIPNILIKLITQRKNTKKKIDYETVTTKSGVAYAGLVKRCDNGDVKLFDVDLGATKHVDAADVASIAPTYNSFEQAVLDALQLAYKVTANSLYGQIGSRTSPIYWKDIAACTTATGRERIMLAKGFVEEKYGAEVIYGDSVTGDTPVLVKDRAGVVRIKTMETLSNEWREYANFRPWHPERHDKQQATFDGQIWSNGAWADVVRVIRHKVNKKMYRVNTFQGCVDVTEDHSLVAADGEKIRPGDCVVGETDILHSYPGAFEERTPMLPRYFKASHNVAVGDVAATQRCNICNVVHPIDMFHVAKGKPVKRCKLCVKMKECERRGREYNGVLTRKVLYYDIPAREVTKEEAWVMGLFFADGSCGRYEECTHGTKTTWAINKGNRDTLNRAMEYLHKVEPTEVVTFKILDTMKSSGCNKLVPIGSHIYMTTKYRELFYDKDKYKKVPDIIINAPKEIKEWFVNGYLTGDGSKDQLAKDRASFACKGKIGAMGLYYVLKAVGRTKLRVNIRECKENTYFISELVGEKYWDETSNKIMKMQKLPDVPEGAFVYDIETSMGKFNGGVGSIVLFNTDSLFLKFPTISVTGERVSGTLAIPLAIAAGQKASKEIKAIMPKPQSLEYEKTLFPFILFSKKRYVGNLYENDANAKPKQKSMGIVLKRRDNAHIVKTIYGGILDHLLNHQDFEASIDLLRHHLQNLVDGQTPLEELVVTKTLRGHYKNPRQIAHKVLADRMGERDAGNKPQANDRVPYVYIVPPAGVEVQLQGDRIEHVDYVRKNGLLPDYRHYITNQIMKPVCQMYALCVERLPGYRFAPGYWEEYAEDLRGQKMYAGKSPKVIKDRITALKMKTVEALLFEPFVDKLEAVVMKKKATSSKGNANVKKAKLAMAVARAAAREEAGCCEVAGPSRTGCVPVIITIRVVEEKKPKRYEGTLTAACGDERWLEVTHTFVPKGKVTPINKTGAGINLAERALTAIGDDKGYSERVRGMGLRWDVEPSLRREWLKAIALRDTLRDRIEKADEEGDTSAKNELEPMRRFDTLVGALALYPYDFVGM